jgi:uncharacterized membrane protein YuzA (DUF378 family)
LDVKFKSTLQIGLLLLTVGVAGVWLIVTFTSPAEEVQLFNVAVTLYVPLIATVVFVLVGAAPVVLNDASHSN